MLLQAVSMGDWSGNSQETSGFYLFIQEMVHSSIITLPHLSTIFIYFFKISKYYNYEIVFFK